MTADFTDAEIRAATRFAKNKGRQIRKHRAEVASLPVGDPTASERDAVTAEAITRLRAHPAVLMAWKATVGRPSKGKYQVAPAGLPDVCLVLRRGCTFGGFEVKRPNVPATFSPSQLETLRAIEVSGGPAGIITSADQAIEKVEAWMGMKG